MFWRRKHREQDLERELRSDLELEAEEQLENGLSSEDARYAARRAFGNATRVKERAREMWGWTTVDQIWHDLRFAIRTVWKSPGFMLAAILTLALGIGANTAIFSVIDTLLLKSLPVSRPQELFVLSIRNIHGDSTSTFSYPLFARLRAEQRSLSGLLAGTGAGRMPIRISTNTTEEARVELVSDDYFRVLGVGAMLGRTFTSREPAVSGQQPVAVLSYGYWNRRFASRREVLGSIVRINNVYYTIIGVTPPGFSGNAVGEPTEVWIPLSTQPLVLPGRDWLHTTSTDWLQLMARLPPGASEHRAQAELQVIVDRLKSERAFRRGMPEGAQIHMMPGSKGFSEIRERFARPLKILMVAVCFLLLIACVNVAHLISARTSARQRELAIRLALGASRSRVLRLIVVENLLLSSAGGFCGLLLAFSSTNPLLLLLAERGGVLLSVHPDSRILGFTGAICILTALLFSVQAVLDPNCQRALPGLRDSIGIAGRPRRAVMGKVLVVLQVALSLMLISGTALLVRTLLNLRSLDPGFLRDHVLFLRIDPVSAGYQGPRTGILNKKLLEQVRSVPGVLSASMSSLPLMEGKNQTCCITVPGYTPATGERMAVRTLDVVPGYFATLGIQRIAGRDFTDLDGRSSPTPVVVNEAFTRHYFRRVAALGTSFQFDRRHVMEIIGVVKNARYDGIQQTVPPMVFFAAPGYQGTLLSLEVRTADDPRAMEAAIRRAVAKVDSALPVREIVTVKSLIDDSLARERLLARLSVVFSLLALGMASIGLYGLMSYCVSKRTNELGVRMALGASRYQLIGLVLRQSIALLVVGTTIGLIASVAASRVLANFLFGITRFDAWSLILSCLILISVGLVAGYVPAHRAAR